jgi:hypothetical protein
MFKGFCAEEAFFFLHIPLLEVLLFCYDVSMPTVNVFYADATLKVQLAATSEDIKTYIANKLSGEDIVLAANEVSVRLIESSGDGMLADIELEITAHAFKPRIDRQDQICLEVREYLKNKLTVDEVRVWLLLPQLGHSWE